MRSFTFLILLMFTIMSCSLDKAAAPEPEWQLVLTGSYELAISEPSDLSYDADSNTLWTVSDTNNKVYEIDLQGNTIRELPFTGTSLEGIACSPADHSLWLAEEELSQIVNITRQGEELARYQIPLETGTNSGLEGICFLPDSTIALVKEKNPGKFIKLNCAYEVEQEILIDFAGDFSAISYNDEDNYYWILSDRAEALYAWTAIDGVMAEYPLPFDKPEGVCYVAELESFFFVSDSQNGLYKMKLEFR